MKLPFSNMFWAIVILLLFFGVFFNGIPQYFEGELERYDQLRLQQARDADRLASESVDSSPRKSSVNNHENARVVELELATTPAQLITDNNVAIPRGKDKNAILEELEKVLDWRSQKIIMLMKKVYEKTTTPPFKSYEYRGEVVPTVAIYRDISCGFDEQKYRLESAYARFMSFIKQEGVFQEERKDMPYAIEHLDELLKSAKTIISDDTFAFKPLIIALLKYYDIIKSVDKWEDRFTELKDVPLQQGKDFYAAGFPKSNDSCNTLSDLTYGPVNEIYDNYKRPVFQDSENWIYSFWARRYYEGNMEDTHFLLTVFDRIASDSFYHIHEAKTEVNVLFPEKFSLPSMRRLPVSDEDNKFVEIYADLNFVEVPEKGILQFDGAHKSKILSGNKVYIYTQEESCAALLKSLEAVDDLADGTGTTHYIIQLDELSPCRGKHAMVSFSEVDSAFQDNIYSPAALTLEESDRVREILFRQHPILKKMALELVAYYNKLGKVFYKLDMGSKSHAIFSIESGGVNWIASIRGSYGSEVDFLPIADLNGNGLPEVIFSDGSRYETDKTIVEMGTGLYLKRLLFFSD